MKIAFLKFIFYLSYSLAYGSLYVCRVMTKMAKWARNQLNTSK